MFYIILLTKTHMKKQTYTQGNPNTEHSTEKNILTLHKNFSLFIIISIQKKKREELYDSEEDLQQH